MLKIETFPVGMLQCNCSIIACDETKEAIIVDPGGDAPKILQKVHDQGLTVKYLLHTHAHFDHVGATAAVRAATGAKVLLHPGDQWLYDNVPLQGQTFGIPTEPTEPIDQGLEHEMQFAFGKHASLVLHTPGHTPGSCCFHVGGTESHLFAGDTLFRNSIGRTDLWGGDAELILKSIKSRLLTLDDSTTVYTGHGPATTLWQEKKANPYLR
ncbi:MAG: MBL fold metallo-hydrolase [Candidatus Melainabacteria bacterium HGW-Melainabacteria-1]|nr:MAG: MBL fold metallo-hydrolase [Candidatus Melainabacteria bacterium HGW-Melainabacteria-1]